MALKSVERLKEQLAVPARQAVTIAVVSLIVALTALLVAMAGGRK